MPKIEFDRTRDGLTFTDSILLTDAEASALTPEDIEAMKDSRFEAWFASVTAPPEE
jgi:hypothetical protein